MYFVLESVIDVHRAIKSVCFPSRNSISRRMEIIFGPLAVPQIWSLQLFSVSQVTFHLCSAARCDVDYILILYLGRAKKKPVAAAHVNLFWNQKFENVSQTLTNFRLIVVLFLALCLKLAWTKAEERGLQAFDDTLSLKSHYFIAVWIENLKTSYREIEKHVRRNVKLVTVNRGHFRHRGRLMESLSALHRWELRFLVCLTCPI